MSANSSPTKTFRYKVYSSAGVYQGDLKGVESDPSFTWNINDAGPQMVITLDKPADSFSEGTLVTFRNKIQVYAIDTEAPTGTLIFQGFISNWTPIYSPGAEKVQITALSYGYELSQIYLQNFTSNITSNTTVLIVDKPPSGARVGMAAQLFKTGPGQTQITAVDLLLDGSSQNMNINIYTVNVSTPNTPNTGSLVGTITKNVPYLSPAIYHFDTSLAPITVSANTQYWFTVDDGGPAGSFDISWNTNSNTYAGGQAAIYDAVANTWTNYTTRALYFVIYPSNQTQVAFTATDIGSIVRAGLDNYTLQGGTLTYDSNSIPLVGTTATYTFNASNINDFLNKMKDLAPPGYFWYVDITTNKVYFQQKGNSAARKFTLGKDLLTIQLQKYMESIVNTLLFTGGATGGVNLFREYIKSDSIALYGVRTGTYNDSNVTGSASADAIAASYFAFSAYPQIRSTVDIIDSAAGGFDIETIRPGDMASFRGFKGSASSLWDVGQWDVDYWDYNINDVNSFVLQITRLQYSPGRMTIDVSMVPPQITAATQALSAAIQQQATISNPSTPTTIYL